MALNDSSGVPRDVFLLDTLSIQPQSLELYNARGQKIPLADYVLEFPAARVRFLVPVQGDSLEFRYKVYPYDLSRPVAHRDTSLILPWSGVITNPFEQQGSGQGQDLLGGSNLKSSGSLARGISFGNSQDLSLQSDFNLQLEGELPDGTHLRAILTDANLPVQPDGTSARVQEFDRVSIELEKGPDRLAAGDIISQENETPFLRFSRKSRGIQYAHEDSGKRFRASAGLARGRFHRQTLPVKEGFLGPYRLRGASGEQFVIVLSGTERVYVDGVLQQRGLEADYTIDYNTAELFFNAGRWLQRNQRLVVEFEYTDRSYNRSMLTAAGQVEGRGRGLSYAWFRESDARLQPTDPLLDQEAQEHLSQLGDQTGQGTFLAADSVGWDPLEIRYERVDSLGFGPIFRYSTVPERAHWRVRFAYVGPNQGHYELSKTPANGKVYDFVPPGGGRPAGSYSPYVRLTAPVATQVLSLGAHARIHPNWTWQGGLAHSTQDLNRYSTMDRADDMGLALSSGLEGDLPLGAGWTLSPEARMEWIQDRFAQVEPIRRVEFNRDFNLQGLPAQPAHQIYARAGTHLSRRQPAITPHPGSSTKPDSQAAHHQLTRQPTTRLSTVQYTLEQLLVLPGQDFDPDQDRVSAFTNTPGDGYFYKGLRHQLLTRTGGVYSTHSRTAWLQAQTPNGSNYGWSGLYGWERRFGAGNRHRLGGAAEGDNRKIPGTLGNSFQEFQRLQTFGSLGPDSTHSWDIQSQRDVRSAPSSVGPATEQNAITSQATYKYMRSIGSFGRMHGLVSAQEVRPYTGDVRSQILRSYAGRAGYLTQSKDQVWQTETRLGLRTGQEEERALAYVEVPPGQGTHRHIDRNQNGIRELDEFEPAYFRDSALFVQIVLPTDAYITVYSPEFYQSLGWDPRGPLGFLSYRGVYQIQKRSDLPLQMELLLPWTHPQSAPLRGLQQQLAQDLDINRGNAPWGLLLRQQSQRQAQTLILGRENQDLDMGNSRLRIRLAQDLEWITASEISQKKSRSQSFPDRNYTYQKWASDPGLRWTALPGMEFMASYGRTYLYTVFWAPAEQTGATLPGLRQTEVKVGVSGSPRSGAITRSNQTSSSQSTGSYQTSAPRTNPSGRIQAQVRYVQNQFTGNANNSLSYEILQGLQPGVNWVSDVNWTRSLGSSMQLNLGYQGRKSRNAPWVHSGSVQVRAFF